MQNISSLYLKSRNECTNEMTFGNNRAYTDNIFHFLTDFIISINYFVYVLTLAVRKRIILKGCSIISSVSFRFRNILHMRLIEGEMVY